MLCCHVASELLGCAQVCKLDEVEPLLLRLQRTRELVEVYRHAGMHAQVR